MSPHERMTQATAFLARHSGMMDAVHDLLEAALEESRDLLEAARTTEEFFQAQGRAHLARHLLGLVNHLNQRNHT